MKLLTNVQAERIDRIALKKHSGTGHSLMKNAGRCVSNLAISILREVKNPEILVICGKGNNGGDGFAGSTVGYGPANYWQTADFNGDERLEINHIANDR